MDLKTIKEYLNKDSIEKLINEDAESQTSVLCRLIRKCTKAEEVYDIYNLAKANLSAFHFKKIIHYYPTELTIPIINTPIVAFFLEFGLDATNDLIRKYYGSNGTWIYLDVFPECLASVGNN